MPSAKSAEPTTATPQRHGELKMELSKSGARWRSFSLIFVGGCVVDATGHLPKKMLRPFLIKDLKNTLKEFEHFKLE